MLNPLAPAGAGEGNKVDGLQFAAILGIAEKNHLLPFDLSQGVVLDDDDFDRQLIFYRGNKLCHQHRKPAVADESNTLPLRICDLRGDTLTERSL